MDMKPTTELRIAASQRDEKGWMSENYLLLPAEEKRSVFF